LQELADGCGTQRIRVDMNEPGGLGRHIRAMQRRGEAEVSAGKACGEQGKSQEVGSHRGQFLFVILHIN
jgi:hypothetical protein